jgi:hypothetical protein
MTLTDLIGRAAQWLITPQKPRPDLAECGRIAIDNAISLWRGNVYDPKVSDKSQLADQSRNIIDICIKYGLGWTWEPYYAGDGRFEWCGAFAAHCWRTVRPELRKTYFASTYRLDRYARYQSVNGEKNKGTGRLIAELDEHSKSLPFEPRTGDILLIGPAGSGYGKHICLVESFDAATGTFHTIEGNGNGLGPDGKKRQGVVRGRRFLGYQAHPENWHARRLIRPSAGDLA